MATLTQSATPITTHFPAGPTTPPALEDKLEVTHIEDDGVPRHIGKTNGSYKYLTQDDIDHFLTHGWLHVPGAIKPEYVERFMKDMWIRVGYDPNDKSTWTNEYLRES